MSNLQLMMELELAHSTMGQVMRFTYLITIILLVLICFASCDKPGYHVVYAGPGGLGTAPDLSVISIEVIQSDGDITALRIVF